jgi:acetyl-CoA carboxylase biotin carboxyl carrier protein
MNLKQLEKIMQLMQQYDLRSIAVSDAETNIKLSRHCGPQVASAAALSSPQQLVVGASAAPATNSAAVTSVAASPSAAAAGEALPPGAEHATAAARRNLKEIRSPFVGTFYTAASPGADPFVYNGKKVKKGEVLCIIEAMKLMNEIEAERDITIVEILVANEEPVEYDQPLFLFE